MVMTNPIVFYDIEWDSFIRILQKENDLLPILNLVLYLKNEWIDGKKPRGFKSYL